MTRKLLAIAGIFAVVLVLQARSGPTATIEGYVIDNACAGSHSTEPTFGERVKNHSTSCALMENCVKSGYAVFTADAKLYKLDKAGIDHGELSNITKHVIVGKSVKMIDFESSSLERRVSNVTSATQAIFIGSGLAKIVQKTYKVPPRPKIISALREYKKQRTQQSFDNVLKTLKL